MKRIVLILAFSMLAAFPSAAQEKPKPDAPKADAPKADAPKADAPKADAKAETLPTADDILDRHVKAVGGKEAIEKLTSRVVKGTFDVEAFSVSGAPVEIFAKAPNLNASKIDIPNLGAFNRGFNGTTGWELNPMVGLRELSGVELAHRKRESDFHLDINYKKYYTKMEVKGKEKVGSYETYLIEATPTEGALEKLYFDVNTGLLVRHDGESDTPDGKTPYESFVDDYKTVDGVKFPHTLKYVTPTISFTMKFTDVKHNVEIDAAKFNKPSGN